MASEMESVYAIIDASGEYLSAVYESDLPRAYAAMKSDFFRFSLGHLADTWLVDGEPMNEGRTMWNLCHDDARIMRDELECAGY